MITIKKMEQRDTNEVYEMMRDFYDSPAILHDVSEEVLRRDIDACSQNIAVVELEHSFLGILRRHIREKLYF